MFLGPPKKGNTLSTYAKNVRQNPPGRTPLHMVRHLEKSLLQPRFQAGQAVPTKKAHAHSPQLSKKNMLQISNLQWDGNHHSTSKVPWLIPQTVVSKTCSIAESGSQLGLPTSRQVWPFSKIRMVLVSRKPQPALRTDFLLNFPRKNDSDCVKKKMYRHESMWHDTINSTVVNG